MRVIRILFFLLFPISVLAQPRFEIQEFTGIVKRISPGFSFALEQLVLDVNGEEESFLFDPYYGELVKSKIEIGDPLTLRASVNLKFRAAKIEKKNLKMLISPFYAFHDRITELKIENEWVPLSEVNNENRPAQYEVYLNRSVQNEYLLNGIRVGLLFEKGLVAFYFMFSDFYDPLKNIVPGTTVSFGGYKSLPKPGYVYPIEGVSEVIRYVPLTELSGKVHSYLFKQNYVCIGAKFNTREGKSISVSFPSDYAERIKKFIIPNQDLKFYYYDYKVEGQLNEPELHAIIQGTDTLYIKQFGFYGGADVEHQHKEARVEGKITKVNTSQKGNIISFIVNSEVLIEVDAMMAQQLWYLFKRGAEISIEGDERIKKQGEIYSRNYRIVVPKKIIINGKEFSTYNP